MKRVRAVWTCVLLLGVLAWGAAASESDVYLATDFNADFEGAWGPVRADGSSFPHGWAARAGNFDLIAPTYDVRHEGYTALRIITSARSGAQILNSVGVPVEQGATYIVSYWVYVKEGGIRMSVVDNTEPRFYPRFNRHSFAEDFEPGEWQYHEIEFVPPEGCQELRLSIVTATDRQVGRSEAYFDDIRIRIKS